MEKQQFVPFYFCWCGWAFNSIKAFNVAMERQHCVPFALLSSFRAAVDIIEYSILWMCGCVLFCPHFSHLSSRCFSINIYNKFIISQKHHMVCMTDNKLIIYILSLVNIACKLQLFCILFCHLWHVWLYGIFPHYLINGMILDKKKVTEHEIRVLIFFTNFVSNISHFDQPLGLVVRASD